jgi:IS5 family transposase
MTTKKAVKAPAKAPEVPKKVAPARIKELVRAALDSENDYRHKKATSDRAREETKKAGVKNLAALAACRAAGIAGSFKDLKTGKNWILRRGSKLNHLQLDETETVEV